MGNKAYVIRISYEDTKSYEFMNKELNAGKLRQGWGAHFADLRKEENEWVRSFLDEQDDSDEKYFRRKYRNLAIMKEIKNGDILLIPKTPEYSCFTVCVASGEYCFEKPENLEEDDFYHYIPIDVGSIRYFGYHTSEKTEIIRAKMRAYQSPVNKIWNGDMLDAIKSLLNEKSSNDQKEIDEIAADVFNNILNNELLQRFRNLGSRNIEKFVQRIFDDAGYEMKGTNSYDRNGGDADLIFSGNAVPEFFEVSDNGLDFNNDIYVQIKNKNGIDLNDTDGVKQLVKRTENIAGSIRILISTADSFTPECKEYARENNVLLISGRGLMQLYLKYKKR